MHLLIDGTYFTNDICLVVYRNNDIKCTQLYRISHSEAYQEIIEDLNNLKCLGIRVSSITCDGHRALLKAVKKVFKNDIIVQRCVVHIQRSARLWLTKAPKNIPSQELLQIVYAISKVKSEFDRQTWLKALYDWDIKHQEYLKQKSINLATGRMWYTHKFVRRARYLLVKAFPNMFHYLYDKAIPKSTNGLESFFGHLKDNLSIHRGLTLNHRKNFIKWYLHFRNEQVSFTRLNEHSQLIEKGEIKSRL